MRAIQWLCFIILFALAFCLSVLTVNGQTLRGDALGLRPTALPATCNIGDLRVDSADAYRLKLCNALNTWSIASFADPMTTDGDLITQAAGVPDRLGIGSTSHVLQVVGGTPAWGFITDANVDAAAGIVDTKLATISTSGKVANSATTAASANTASAIVARDPSGNFTAGTITAALTGNVTGNVSGSSGSTTGNAATATALAANPTDCASDTYANAIAASGNLTCASITNAATTAASANTASAIVARDVSGNFTAGTITAALTGTASGNIANTLTSTTGDIIYASSANTPARLAIGTTSQVLTVIGGIPSWQNSTTVPAPWYVKARITSSGSVTSLGTAAINSDTEIADSTLTMTPYSGSNAVGTMCSSTNAATAPSTSATTCAAGNEVLGGSFDVVSGDEVYPFEVCIEFSWRAEVDSGETLDNMFVLGETATNAGTILQEGVRLDALLQGGSTSGNSLIVDHPFRLCGLFKFASSGTKGFRLFVQQFIGGTPNASSILTDAAFASRNVMFTAKRLN